MSGTATNNGFGIRSDNNIDGWSPTTTGAATVANRPKLTVNYTTNPAARRVRYQQNVNGYTGTTDSFINGINGADPALLSSGRRSSTGSSTARTPPAPTTLLTSPTLPSSTTST